MIVDRIWQLLEKINKDVKDIEDAKVHQMGSLSETCLKIIALSAFSIAIMIATHLYGSSFSSRFK